MLQACTGPYSIPNLKVDAYSVYTNNLPGGAFRGFGGPQGAFVAESQMNKLAERLGLDPVEIRMDNLLEDGMISSVGTPLPGGVPIKQVVRQCAEAAGWPHSTKSRQRPEDPSHIARGGGFACGFKNVGFGFGFPEQCQVTIELHGEAEIEWVVLRHGGVDLGQGAYTVTTQMAAEACGVSLDKIKLVVADTAATPDSGSTSASRLTLMAGNAIQGAAKAALEKWHSEDRPAIATHQYRPQQTTPLDSETGEGIPNYAYGYAAEYVEVEVNMQTGHVRVPSVVCTVDAGKAINPQQIKGQIEGAIVQAHGYALQENFIMKDGYVQTPYLSNYLLPTVLDVPEQIKSVILEYPDPNGPWGVRGVAEMGYLPYAAAVVAAVRDATGIWIDEFPLTPERVLVALKGRAKAV